MFLSLFAIQTSLIVRKDNQKDGTQEGERWLAELDALMSLKSGRSRRLQKLQEKTVFTEVSSQDELKCGDGYAEFCSE